VEVGEGEGKGKGEEGTGGKGRGKVGREKERREGRGRNGTPHFSAQSDAYAWPYYAETRIFNNMKISEHP